MAEREPGVIAVEETVEGTIEASRAVLQVSVQGENFFYGRAALDKAKELRELIEQLRAGGVAPEDIEVQGVSLSSKSGLFGQNSRCRYQLSLAVRDFARMPEVLGAIADAKNATLDSLEWRYDGESEATLRLLTLATERASAKAQAIAKVLGMRVAGPKRISDRIQVGERGPVRFGELTAPAMPSRARAATVDLGTEFSHRNHLRVAISAEFWVAPEP